jgi:hypothetical protein
MHLVKGHHCCQNFLAKPIRREEKFGPTSKLAIFEQKYKLSKRTNRQISLALWDGTGKGEEGGSAEILQENNGKRGEKKKSDFQYWIIMMLK